MSTPQDTFGSMSNAADHAANDMKSGAKSAYDSGTSELKSFVNDVEDLVERVANVKGSDVERVRSKVQQSLERAKARLNDASASARKGAGQLAESTDNYVRQSPWQSVGIAAFLGVVAGLLVSRRE